ncbi:MAG: glycosyltransferase, partial [Bradymonadaceae bacterium]
MARVLLLTTSEKGHLNPMMGVAQWLGRQGHEVGWTCLPSAPDYLTEMGIEPVPIELEEGDEDLATGGAELAELVRDEERLYRWVRTLLLDGVDEQVGPMRQVLRDWQPDVLTTDPMIYAGIIAAHCEEIPYACVSSSLNPVTPEEIECAHARNMQRLSEDRRALFEKYGLSPRFRVADCLSPHLNAVFTTREYVGDVEVPPKTHLVGPSV